MMIPENLKKQTENNELVKRTQLLLTKIAENPDFTNEDKDEIHQFILECIKRFSNYVVATNNYVFTIHSISELRVAGVIGQDEFERRLKNADSTRRGKHDLSIDACNQLNRQCDFYQIPRICDIDTQNRAEVANFTARFAMAAHGYALNHNYTMDEVVQMLDNDPRMLNGNTIFERS